nr:DUF6538 domain-containing protein [uncultured Celeribacter sp.]
MAGKVRHLVTRSGRYHARLVVPKELRRIIEKTEIRTSLGGDYRKQPGVYAGSFRLSAVSAAMFVPEYAGW